MSAEVLLIAAASAIRAEHEAVERSTGEMISHAIRCGELLLEVKAGLRHGAFGPWLAANVEFSDRTARGYMRIASLTEEKRQRVADLSLRKATRSIAVVGTLLLKAESDFIEKAEAQIAESLEAMARYYAAKTLLRACRAASEAGDAEQFFNLGDAAVDALAAWLDSDRSSLSCEDKLVIASDESLHADCSAIRRFAEAAP